MGKLGPRRIIGLSVGLQSIYLDCGMKTVEDRRVGQLPA